MGQRPVNRITFDGKGGATPAERWSVGHRIRDVEVAPDGAVWMLEDAKPGARLRLTPNSRALGPRTKDQVPRTLGSNQVKMQELIEGAFFVTVECPAFDETVLAIE